MHYSFSERVGMINVIAPPPFHDQLLTCKEQAFMSGFSVFSAMDY